MHKLTDQQIDAIIAGIKAQVEWNGWEEPYVRERFKKELARAYAEEPAVARCTGDNATAVDQAAGPIHGHKVWP